MTNTSAIERRSNRSPTWIDAYIGRRIYQRRTDLGLSQSELARQVGITFQQIQKFEIGLNVLPLLAWPTLPQRLALRLVTSFRAGHTRLKI
jgi:transcriptional regulator with XRE-family HTH domain